MEEDIDDLRSVQPDLVSENMDAASYTDVDAEVLAVQPPPSDVGIVEELLETEDVSNDNDDTFETEEEHVYCPDRKELLQIIETKKFDCYHSYEEFRS